MNFLAGLLGSSSRSISHPISRSTGRPLVGHGGPSYAPPIVVHWGPPSPSSQWDFAQVPPSVYRAPSSPSRGDKMNTSDAACYAVGLIVLIMGIALVILGYGYKVDEAIYAGFAIALLGIGFALLPRCCNLNKKANPPRDSIRDEYMPRPSAPDQERSIYEPSAPPAEDPGEA